MHSRLQITFRFEFPSVRPWSRRWSLLLFLSFIDFDESDHGDVRRVASHRSITSQRASLLDCALSLFSAVGKGETDLPLPLRLLVPRLIDLLHPVPGQRALLYPTPSNSSLDRPIPRRCSVAFPFALPPRLTFSPINLVSTLLPLESGHPSSDETGRPRVESTTGRKGRGWQSRLGDTIRYGGR